MANIEVFIPEMEEKLISQPVESLFSQNYPNPSNPHKSNEHVPLKIYDILGREIASLVNEQKSAGHYKVNFDANNLTSGVYLYRLNTSSGYTMTKKLMLLK